MLHLIFEQFVVICGMTGLEGKIGRVEVIVVLSQERPLYSTISIDSSSHTSHASQPGWGYY